MNPSGSSHNVDAGSEREFGNLGESLVFKQAMITGHISILQKYNNYPLSTEVLHLSPQVVF